MASRRLLLLVALVTTMSAAWAQEAELRAINEIVGRWALPTPADNAFDDYLRAFALMHDVEGVGNAYAAGRGGAVPLEGLLQANAPALAALREGLPKQCLMPPITALDALLPYLAQARQMARLLVLEGWQHERNGAYDLALRSYLDALKLGQDLSRGGAVLHRLVSVAVEAIALNPIRQAAESGALPLEVLQEGIRELGAAGEREPPLAHTAAMQLAEAAAVLQDLVNRPDRDQLVRDALGPEAPPGGVDLSQLRLGAELQAAIAWYRGVTGEAGMPTSPVAGTGQSVLPPALTASSDLWVTKVAGARALFGAVQVCLAAEAFRAEHGTPATQLAELAPRYLAAAPDETRMARTFLRWGQEARARSDALHALQYLRLSTGLCEQGAGSPVTLAMALRLTSKVLAEQGQAAEAEALLARSEAALAALPPDSPQLAAELWDAAMLISQNRPALPPGMTSYGEAFPDADMAAEFADRSVAIRAGLGEDSLDLARAYTTTARWHGEGGAYGDADADLQQAIAMLQRLAPESADLCRAVWALAVNDSMQGEINAAIVHGQQALGLARRASLAQGELAYLLYNIAGFYQARGDDEMANRFYAEGTLDEGRAIAGRSNPEMDALLARVVARRLAAIDLHRGRADLAIAALLPATDGGADFLVVSDLVQAYLVAGDTDAAMTWAQQALTAAERTAGGGAELTVALVDLARVYLRCGEGDEARRCLERSVAPRTVAETRQAADPYIGPLLAQTDEQRGLLPDARDLYGRLVDRVEASRTRARGQGGTGLVGESADAYYGLMRVQAKLGEVAEAASTAERLRARAFLEVLAERPLAVSRVNPEMAEKAAQYARRRVALNDQLGALAGPDAEGKRGALEAELARLQLADDALAAEARQADPRYAALQYPEPLTAQEIAARVDPGTLVLMYAVDRGSSRVFALGRDLPVEYHEIPVGLDGLRDQTSKLLDALAAREDVGAPVKELGGLLLGPVADAIAQAERVLLLPDGPLWLMPF